MGEGAAQAAKKVSTATNKAIIDVTDNDPIDPGQAFLTMIYREGEKPAEQDYKFANKVSNNKKHKYIVGAIISQLPFWMYLIFDYITRWGF